MECPFVVGDKVTMVWDEPWHDGDGTPAPDFLNLPVFGVVYTVSWVGLDPAGVVAIRLLEIKNKPHMTNFGLWELSCSPYNFRKVLERKTDISVFTELLIPFKAKELT